MATGPFGTAAGVVGAFGSKKLRAKYDSPELGKQIEGTASGIGDDQAHNASSLMQYDSREAQRALDAARLGKQAETDFGGLLSTGQQMVAQDPKDTYTSLRSGNLSTLNDFSDLLANAGDKRQNIAKLSLGYSGDRGGSYADAIGNRDFASTLGMAYNNIMSGLTPATQAITQGRNLNFANNQSLANLINQRTGTYNVGEGLELNPAFARNQLRGGTIANEKALADAAKANIAGWYIKPNGADRAAGVLNAMDAGDMGAQLVNSYLGGGGGGGGANRGSLAQMGQLVSQGNSGPAVSYGPYGGGGYYDQGPVQEGAATSGPSGGAGGKMDIGSILKLAGMFL